MSRPDVIIVASVSCIFGIGSVSNYDHFRLDLEVDQKIKLTEVLKQLAKGQYRRNDSAPQRGHFRQKGDTLDVYPAGSELIYRIEFFGDQIESLKILDNFKQEITAQKTKKISHLSSQPLRHP